MAIDIIGDGHHGVIAHALGANQQIFACPADRRVLVSSWGFGRTVMDGDFDLHFGDAADTLRFWRLPSSAPAGVEQGRGSAHVIGPLGKALKFSATGTGVLNGGFQARLVDANGVG